MQRLRELQNNLDNEKLLIGLQELCEYLQRNQKYIVNYQQRKKAGLPFTSTIAESSVNEIINTRQKNNKKMQWSREGAHNVLQIRTARFSKTWDNDWVKAQEKIYKTAA